MAASRPRNTPMPTSPATRTTSGASAGRDTYFADLGVHPVLVDALAAGGINSPFPIQTATLPDSLAGRDVLGRGRTGSGKTYAFALPDAVSARGQPASAVPAARAR